MAAAERSARSRSRSPRREEDLCAGTETSAPGPDGSAPAAAPQAPQVPAHWLKPADSKAADAAGEEAGGAAPAAATRKAKGGKGRKGSGRGDAGGGGAGDGAAPAAPSATSLLALASRVEGGDAEARPEPGELARVLRQSAARIGALERAVGDLGQTIQTIGALSGRAMESLGAPQAADDAPAEPQDATKSFLIKRGDEDVQEQYRAQAQARPTHGSGVSSAGGALAASAKTKDEMDQARRARLEKLEAMQAEKKKQMEDAEKRSKAHDALFNLGLAGAGKPLGKL